MLSTLAWLAALGPMVLAAIGLTPDPRTASSRMARFRAAAIFSLAVAVLAATATAVNGSVETPTLGIAGVGFSLYVDALSATMFVLVSFVGAVVVAFSAGYLDGDPDQLRFMRRLCVTLAAILLLIISGNLLQFWLAFVATSLGLNGLLVFYRDRQAAVLAARKKFLTSRLADVCLAAACLAIYIALGSADYRSIFLAAETMRVAGDIPALLPTAAGLIAAAALLKSAQFPVHGWLIEVMETPTPVSALLHAGIINAGGFMVLRFAYLISLSPQTQDVLAIVGMITALFGSLVMLTQTSVKVSLAYSTIAQMGFMMLECGLGAYGAALLHIVAHSLYKAHAFLSSGSVIDIARASWTPRPGGRPHPARLLIAIAVALGVTLAVGLCFGETLDHKPGALVLSAVLVIGLVNLLANSLDDAPQAYVVGRAVLIAAFVAALSFGLQRAFDALLGTSVPLGGGPSGAYMVIAGLVIVSFGALTLFQSQLPRHADEPRWQALYAHIANGLYINTLVNRWVLRFWPLPNPGKSQLTSQQGAFE
jgi:NAD(P)H-quinone oxidoreductase subunit 5